ncbi:MAG: YIP1 family protein [bacterium]
MNFYSLAFHPTVSWDGFLLRRGFLTPLLFFVAAQIFQMVAFSVFDGNFFLVLPVLVAQWFLAVSLYHLFANFLGGRGNIISLLYLWAFAGIPVFFLPAVRIFHETVFGGNIVLWFFEVLLIYLWSVVLHAKAIKAVYHVSIFTAFFVLISPFVLLAAMGGIAAFLYTATVFI